VTFTLQIPKKSLRGLVLGGLCIASIILFLAALRFATSEPGAEAPLPVAPRVAHAAAVPALDAPRAVLPTVGAPEGAPVALGEAPRAPAPSSPQAAPPPQAESVAAGSGTITSPGSRWPLVVDGKRISTVSAMVSCGRHTVRVGRSKPRDVVVPCGATVRLDQTGRPDDP
jgi:hypothetical protein